MEHLYRTTDLAKRSRVIHPFQVGDLVRSTKHPSNLAIIVEIHRTDPPQWGKVAFWIDAKYLRGGVVVEWIPVNRFTLLSRGETE